MAKKAKKFELSRKDLVAQLDELIDRLNNVDTYATSPSDVLDEVTDITTQLEDLRARVQDVA